MSVFLAAVASAGLGASAVAAAGWSACDFCTQRVCVVYADAAAAARASVSFSELPAGKHTAFATRWDDRNPRHLQMAEALESVGARATFFINGNPAGYEGTLKRLLAGGHSIGAHSMSHPFLGHLTPFGVFREVLENRILLEVASQSPVTLFSLPFGHTSCPGDAETAPRIGAALVNAGFVGGPEFSDTNADFGLPESRWFGSGYFSINDRAPDAALFAKGLLALTNAIAGGKARHGPFVTLGTHTWQKDDGLKTLSEILRPCVARKDVYVANGNDCAARRLAALNASVRRVSLTGKTADYEIRRLSPRVLGSEAPLQLVFSERPVSVAANGCRVTDGVLPVVPDSQGPVVFSLTAGALTADRALQSFSADVRNETKEAWRDVVCTLRLPPGFEPGVQCRRFAELAPGAAIRLSFAAAWRAPEKMPSGDLFAAVQVDLSSASGGSVRRWLTGTVSRPAGDGAVPRDRCRAAGPVGKTTVDFAELSVPGAELRPLDASAAGAWRSTAARAEYRPVCVNASPRKPVGAVPETAGALLALAADFDVDTVRDGASWRLTFFTQSLPQNVFTAYLNGKPLPDRVTQLDLRNGANRLVLVHPWAKSYNYRHVLSLVSVKTGAEPVYLTLGASASVGAEVSAQDFAREVERVLPVEKPYDYHRHLETAPVHVVRRAPDARLAAGEMALPEHGWKIVWNPSGGEILRNAVLDFQDYLKVSMGVRVELEERTSLDGWQGLSSCIVVGTCEQLPGCGGKLKGPKDYRLSVTSERVTVCGYDERGAAFGLYNLEARMNLREAPFLRADLDTVRHSLYDVRMAQSWMGWMEFPDALLSRMAHDGFDAIFASALTNPNGDRTTAETSTDFFARILHKKRRQDPAKMHDLIRRAAKVGIKVYTPIIYQYLGTPESEAGLRKLVRDIVREFPDIRGYVLLTEGFWYKKWGGQDAGKEYLMDWARNWCKAVAIVAEECHRVNPAIEILPWEYNINFRPENADVKRYFIRQLPQDTTPLLSWENGKRLDLDEFAGWVRDYSVSTVGPAEVTEAQIRETHRRKMRAYVNGDTFVCGAQLQTVPYQPFPYQWHARYRAMEKHGVNGTMESWSQGYNPNVMTELRSWYCWSEAPEIDELLGEIAAREFGSANRETVLKAWKLFSEAIRLVPDTGPYLTGSAVGNPIFLKEPPVRAMTQIHSWSYDASAMDEMDKADGINPYWPFTVARMVFVPDFANKANRAENYARFVSGVETAADKPFLPVFLKHLRLAAEKMEDGLRLYRAAALASPAAKRRTAIRETVVAEQLGRMLESDRAILEFEDLRLKLATERDAQKSGMLLERMEAILRDEIVRTERSLVAAMRDSRLGFQQETDYVYTPYSLEEKLKSLHETLEKELPKAR